MDDYKNLPLNTPVEFGGRLCKVVACGDDFDLLVWVPTGPDSGFWLV